MPELNDFYNSKLGYMVSNALLKSMMTPTVYCLFSVADVRSGRCRLKVYM